MILAKQQRQKQQ